MYLAVQYEVAKEMSFPTDINLFDKLVPKRTIYKTRLPLFHIALGSFNSFTGSYYLLIKSR